MYTQTLPSNVNVIAYTHVYTIYAKSKNKTLLLMLLSWKSQILGRVALG